MPSRRRLRRVRRNKHRWRSRIDCQRRSLCRRHARRESLGLQQLAEPESRPLGLRPMRRSRAAARVTELPLCRHRRLARTRRRGGRWSGRLLSTLEHRLRLDLLRPEPGPMTTRPASRSKRRWRIHCSSYIRQGQRTTGQEHSGENALRQCTAHRVLSHRSS